MTEATDELNDQSAEGAETGEGQTLPTEPSEGEKDQRGGGDGKAKALGKPGLGEHGRPNRRETADE